MTRSADSELPAPRGGGANAAAAGRDGPAPDQADTKCFFGSFTKLAMHFWQQK